VVVEGSWKGSDEGKNTKGAANDALEFIVSMSPTRLFLGTVASQQSQLLLHLAPLV
jgi:hypothetical protein